MEAAICFLPLQRLCCASSVIVAGQQVQQHIFCCSEVFFFFPGSSQRWAQWNRPIPGAAVKFLMNNKLRRPSVAIFTPLHQQQLVANTRLPICFCDTEIHGWMDGWMDGWMGRWDYRGRATARSGPSRTRLAAELRLHLQLRVGLTQRTSHLRVPH